MSDAETEIAVVGAGPVGLAAALELTRIGYSVALVAPAHPPGDERTSALLAGSIAFLERIGVWARLAPQTAPLRTLRIVDATGRLIRAPEVTFDSSEIGLDAFGYNVPNRALVSALSVALDNSGVVRREALVEDATAAEGSVQLRLADGSKLAAALAVAADGRNSKMRMAAGISVRSWRYEQAALVVNLRHSQPHHDTSTEFHTRSGPFTLVPLPGRRSSLVWVGTRAETDARAALPDGALAREIEEHSASILGTIEIDGKRQVFPLSGMTAHRFAASRVALVGEAAHVFPPIGAQGLNLGYRDVAALGEILAGAPSDPGKSRFLVEFEKARRGDVATRTAAVDALNRSLLTGFLPIQGLRGLGLFLLDRLPPLRRAVMRQGIADGWTGSVEGINRQLPVEDQTQDHGHGDDRHRRSN